MTPQTFEQAFDRVKQLASVFQQNEKQYLSASYSEAQARLDFIDKFWVALGWDVNHETSNQSLRAGSKSRTGRERERGA